MTLNWQIWPFAPGRWISGVLAWLVAVFIVAACPQTVLAQTDRDRNDGVIGEVALIKGGVTTSSEMRIDRDLVVGSPVFAGDVIETDRRSFVAIRFIDGGKLTLQPSSKIDLQEFNDRIAQESQTFELLKGGLRAVTGLIGKRRPNQVTYFGQGVTVGIRGTAFAMRLCPRGVQRCKFDRGINFQGRIVANKPDGGEVQMFVRDRGSDRRRRIKPEELGLYLKDSFVGLIEGKIRVLTEDYAIDMEVASGSRDQPQPTGPGQATPVQQPGPQLPQQPKQQPPAKQPTQSVKKSPPAPSGGGQ